MNILLLGGTGDALTIARSLIAAGCSVTYSIAGLAATPELDCPVRVGGFGGWEGLAAALRQQDADLLLDATHPYAAAISVNAAYAAKAAGVPLLRFARPAWRPADGDHWLYVNNCWTAIAAGVAGYRCPFFTIGREPLEHAGDIRSGQQWLVRTLAGDSAVTDPNIHIIRSRGPFKLSEERALMKLSGVDVLVSKNSGGEAVASKITAARELGIPVLMLQRPELARVDREFDSVESLLAAVGQA